MRCHNLEIFRNCAYEYPLLLVDTGGFPEDLFGWQFAFVIAPTNVNRTFGTAVITNTTPIVASGSNEVIFILSALETALLRIGTAYEYRVIAEPPGFDQGVLEYGFIKLTDSPVEFPSG
jgi:hypothetical protein